jgi:hypothetical protein
MTLKQLEAFYLAANLGSFALAAQRLHVTQSSLSNANCGVTGNSPGTLCFAPLEAYYRRHR